MRELVSQSLDRTQPGLPLKKGRAATMTRDYKRNGTTTLVAAIDEYLAHHNSNPKPFFWTKSARDILQKVIRANSPLRSKQNASRH